MFSRIYRYRVNYYLYFSYPVTTNDESSTYFSRYSIRLYKF